MSYKALYRKWRPDTFEEVKGQEHIVTTLRNQITHDRIGHAYLFCGTRGTGKTTVAKLFAKAVNCEHPVDGSPCGECASCRSIAEGTSMNVIEIDAASNNGVDNIREIRDEVQYSPTEGKYKVYIIDEVHMLSIGAFNALLKTLEEPPAYAVFLLLAQNTSVFLPTVLSRCVSIALHPAPEKDLVAALTAAGVPENEARIAARLSHGNPGRCMELAEEELRQFREEQVLFLEKLAETDSHRILQYAEKLSGGGKGDAPSYMEDFLDLGRSWYRDILVQKSTQDPENLIYRDQIQYIISAAARLSFEDLENIQTAFDDAGRRRSSKENDT